MKKVLFSVLVILLVAGCAVFLFPGKTGSDQYVSGDYRFTILGDDTVAVTRYSGKAAVVSVPDTLDNRRVTAIGDSAFSLCLNIKEVDIPDGVVRIGKNAFACCPFLVSVTLPDSLESIGETRSTAVIPWNRSRFRTGSRRSGNPRSSTVIPFLP